MITIYKTRYEFYGFTYVLCISFSESIQTRINDWNVALDRIVFDEQMATGSFRGRWPIDDSQRSQMKMLQEEGIIQPYYGATNARACIYALQVTPPTCTLEVEHTVVKESERFEDAVTILQAVASEVERNHEKRFMIKENEYQSLQKWAFWNSGDEFTSWYIYTFSPSTIGLVTKVTDTRTNEIINITDYDNW